MWSKRAVISPYLCVVNVVLCKYNPRCVFFGTFPLFHIYLSKVIAIFLIHNACLRRKKKTIFFCGMILVSFRVGPQSSRMLFEFVNRKSDSWEKQTIFDSLSLKKLTAEKKIFDV